MAVAQDETAEHPTQHLPAETWDGHVLLRHQDVSRRHASVAWVNRGVELGEKIIQVVPGPDTAVTSSGVPGQREEPATSYDGTGVPGARVEVVRDSSVLDHAALVEARSRARSEGWTGVRVMALGSSTRTRAASIALEDDAERACGLEGVSVLCDQLVDDWGHVRSGAEPTQAHRSVVHHNAWLRHEAGRLVVVGEVDLANAASLVDALARACTGATPGGELTIDCSRWQFADITAARAMLATSRAFREGGGDVHLTGVRGALASVLEVVGGNAVHGLHVSGPEVRTTS